MVDFGPIQHRWSGALMIFQLSNLQLKLILRELQQVEDTKYNIFLTLIPENKDTQLTENFR